VQRKWLLAQLLSLDAPLLAGGGKLGVPGCQDGFGTAFEFVLGGDVIDGAVGSGRSAAGVVRPPSGVVALSEGRQHPTAWPVGQLPCGLPLRTNASTRT
jgi:hypothetical protein